MDKQTAIGKIKKCLALAKSGEPHEAAAAMRQAQKLIEQFGIENPEWLAAGIAEEWAKSAAQRRPVRYEVALASGIARAYGCELLFTRRINQRASRIDGGYTFIGVEPTPEICWYTLEVLVRQLRAARRTHIQSALRRCGTRNKMARADEFCEGWVATVLRSVVPSPNGADNKALIDSYMRANYAHVSEFEPTSREVKNRRDSWASDFRAGVASGVNARVNKGIGAEHETRRLTHV